MSPHRALPGDQRTVVPAQGDGVVTRTDGVTVRHKGRTGGRALKLHHEVREFQALGSELVDPSGVGSQPRCSTSIIPTSLVGFDHKKLWPTPLANQSWRDGKRDGGHRFYSRSLLRWRCRRPPRQCFAESAT
jgi:hypothetical protein